MGIAITAMNFFTDPTIATLTSGPLSQNVDLGGISFPRRMGVRFNPDFMAKYQLKGLQCRWQAYRDDMFTESLGKAFYHEDTISFVGWANYYFEGKFENEVAYVKLQIHNPTTGLLLRTFYFRFTKGYLTTLDGKKYMLDPILDERIVKNGWLEELLPEKQNGQVVRYVLGQSTYKAEKVVNIEENPVKEKVDVEVFLMSNVRYSEKAKAIFLVTPPHLMSYAKLILILLKQLVDLNFESSYLTKASQKPLLKTRFMLDELGNLQSEGQGIKNFNTMLSIGLGQSQQFFMILQTLQQLRDVYGDSSDKVIQGNTSNIIFLKSTDDQMIDTLSKMSGTTHKVFQDSKTVTKDIEKIFMQTEGKVSYTQTAREVPVISYNDMAFIPPSNSIVFRAGDSPIWNRNETALPMSWRLFQNTISVPGVKYSLQTVPSLSNAMYFDVRKNQPDFEKMLQKRLDQALYAVRAKEVFKEGYEYSDYQISQLDPDNYSDEIMIMVNNGLRRDKTGYQDELSDYEISLGDMWQPEENTEQIKVNAELNEQSKAYNRKIYADGRIARSELVTIDGRVAGHGLDMDVVQIYRKYRNRFAEDKLFRIDDDTSLYGADGELYIKALSEKQFTRAIKKASTESGNRIYDEDNGIDELTGGVDISYEVKDAFYRFLVSLDKWSFIDGIFDKEIRRIFDDE